jgi:hypothetical protein
MNTKNRFKAPLALAAALALPIFTNGCGEDNVLCCTEFEVGADIQANIGGSAQSQVAVQAVADFAGIASAAIEDITTACRGMAEDLDAPAAERQAAEANDDKRKRMNAWCSLAVSAIGSFKASAGGSLTVNFQPPQCSASVSAKANCQANCSVDAACDIKANPPTCEGGKLEVSCSGSCTAEAGATLSCEGSCSGSCSGSCTAQGGVQCQGRCQGECKGSAQGGTGEGIQADGSCNGTCEGTCEVTAPGVQCEGSCNGECSGSCEASAGATVKCDGKCEGDFEPLKCTGGELKGGCEVDAKCDANCDASVSAKAECTPPAVNVAFSGAANVEAAARLKGTFEANLGVILAFTAKLEAMGKIAVGFTGNVSAVTDIKAACIPVVVAAAGRAVGDVEASASAAGSIVATIN